MAGSADRLVTITSRETGLPGRRVRLYLTGTTCARICAEAGGAAATRAATPMRVISFMDAPLGRRYCTITEYVSVFV